MIRITGFIKRLSTIDNNEDPAKADRNAMSAIQVKFFQCISTFLAYWTAAKEVPVKAGIFKLPITVATAYCGNKTNAAGV